MPYGKDDKVSYCFHCMEILDENDAVCPHCKRKTNSVRENVRTLPPGIVLENKYMVGEVIGEGGFGITYIGLDLNLHLKVAIKEYFPASFASRNINTGADYSIHVIRGEIFFMLIIRHIWCWNIFMVIICESIWEKTEINYNGMKPIS